jgi:hypothetical protein
MRVLQKSALAMSLARCDPRDGFKDRTITLPTRIASPRLLTILLHRQPDFRLTTEVVISEGRSGGQKIPENVAGISRLAQGDDGD